MAGRQRIDDLDDHGRREPPRRRPSRGKVIAPLAGALALAVLSGVGAAVIVTRDPGCGRERTDLTVVASPDLAPALDRIAARITARQVEVADRCLAVRIQRADPASVTDSLSGTGSAAGSFPGDVWIPDSSVWVARAAEAAPGFTGTTVGSAATSPVVLTVPRAAVAELRTAFGEASWSGLMSAANVANPEGLGRKVRILAPDPARNATGLNALLAGSGVLERSGAGEEQLVGVLRRLAESAVPQSADLFPALAETSDRIPIGIASEQAVWAYNEAGPPQPAAALYPIEGTIDLDYPIVVTATDERTRTAAEVFRQELATPAAKKIISEHGFRTADRTGSALDERHGVRAEAPRALPLPEEAAVTRLLQAWSRLKLGSKILALIDVSGTMAHPAVGASGDRMRLVAQTAIEGLKIQPDQTEVGAWIFATHLNGRGVDYKEVVSTGPLGEKVGDVTRRELLVRTLTGLRAERTKDTGLNDTLAAAYDVMKAEYEADKVNVIVVFTDGVGNDDPDGGLSNAALLRKLQAEFDPAQPISVIIIALGADDAAGRRQMEAIAKATRGQAFFPRDALEIRQVFLEGMARRLCAPNCSGDG